MISFIAIAKYHKAHTTAMHVVAQNINEAAGIMLRSSPYMHGVISMTNYQTSVLECRSGADLIRISELLEDNGGYLRHNDNCIEFKLSVEGTLFILRKQDPFVVC